MEISSSVFYSLIIALLASFTLITIYYSIVFFLRSRLLLLTAAGSEESPWSSKGVDIETSSSSHSRLDINNYNKGDNVAGAAVEQKCAAECLSEFEYGDAVRVLPECSRFFHVGCIKEWLKLHSCCPVCRAKTMTKTAGRHEKHKIASPAVDSDYCDGGRGSWTAALFWWAAVEDCAIVI